MTTVRRDGNGQIQRSNGSGAATDRGEGMASFLASMGPQIRMALPKHLDGDRMARVALTALRTTPKLAECDKWSFAASILQAAQLGLEVNTPLGHAYLIPRKGQCTLQIGYQGMIELARRSGQVATIYAYTVHKSDDFRYELGLDPKLHHVPDVDGEQSERTMTFVYAVAALRSGESDRQFVVLSKKQVDERKARGAGGPAWRTDYLAMARKTAVRALFTWLPKSPEMARAVAVDDAEVTGSVRSALDTDVVNALDTMQLPPPPEDEAPVLTDGGDEPTDT